MPNPPLPRRRSLIGRVWRRLRWLVPIAAALLVCELLLRVFAPQPSSWVPIYGLHPTKPMHRVKPDITLAIDTGETRWVVHTDEQGLRIPERGRARKTAPVILVIGGSNSFGYSIAEEQTFSHLLDDRYGDRFAVINAAQPSYGPLQYRFQLEHMLAVGIRPALVVCVMYAGNDILDLLVDKAEAIDALNQNPGLLQPLKHASHLYRFVSRAYHRLCSTSPYFVHMPHDLVLPETWLMADMQRGCTLCREEMQRMQSICDGIGAGLFAAIIPVPLAIDARAGHIPPQPGTDYDLPLRKLADACSAASVRWIDLTDTLAVRPVRETFFAFDGHLNPLGHAMVADRLDAEIRRAATPAVPAATGLQPSRQDKR